MYNKENLMHPILSNYTVSVSELRKSPTQILEKAGSQVVAILNHNTPSAYLVPSKTYEMLMDMLDDAKLSQTVKERLNYDSEDLIEVSIDEL
jgi:antitoxin StbD